MSFVMHPVNQNKDNGVEKRERGLSQCQRPTSCTLKCLDVYWDASCFGTKSNQRLRRHNWHFFYAQCRSLKVKLTTLCPSETAALLLFQRTHRDLHDAGMHFIRGHSCQPLPSVCHLPRIGSFFPLTPVADPYVKYATEEINEIIRDLIWIFD